MKKLIFILVSNFFMVSCSKDNPTTASSNLVDQLSPATQTRANTFGCLLDGEIFKSGISNKSYQCFYQLVDGEYYFNVNANNKKAGILKSLIVGTQKLLISQGLTLILKKKNIWKYVCHILFRGFIYRYR